MVYPPGRFIFEAFNRTPFNKVKVVIIGQDPYHNPRQAHGLCFSVQDGVELPPSLINIYKELESEYGKSFRERNGDLSHWADQGAGSPSYTCTYYPPKSLIVRGGDGDRSRGCSLRSRGPHRV